MNVQYVRENIIEYIYIALKGIRILKFLHKRLVFKANTLRLLTNPLLCFVIQAMLEALESVRMAVEDGRMTKSDYYFKFTTTKFNKQVSNTN